MRPGSNIGRYVLLRPIGRGGSANVWAARLESERGFSKLFAIKTIAKEYATNAQYARALMDEARVAAAVNHPNLCELYEIARHDGALYLSLEWIDGDSLESLIRARGGRAGLEPALAARIVADACAGLHALHEARDSSGRSLEIVHRDVSPHNILLTSTGHTKLSDFGIAKARDEYRARTRSGHIKGKLGYLAPEQLRGDRVDRRTDIFAMGCVLFTTCLGQLAFPATRAGLSKIAQAEYQPPSALRPDFPRALTQIIERALHVDPERRFSNAAEMRMELETWLVRSRAVVTHYDVAEALRERLGGVIAERNASIQRACRALLH